MGTYTFTQSQTGFSEDVVITANWININNGVFVCNYNGRGGHDGGQCTDPDTCASTHIQSSYGVVYS